MIIGLVTAAVAVFALATAVVPRWRGVMHWRGTRVRAGVLSSLGFGLVFGAVALLFLSEGVLADNHRTWFVLLLLPAGIVAILIGQYLDFRQSRCPRRNPE